MTPSILVDRTNLFQAGGPDFWPVSYGGLEDCIWVHRPGFLIDAQVFVILLDNLFFNLMNCSVWEQGSQL